MIIDWIKEKFTKKKEPLITVFSTIKGLEEIYPPSSAIESIPEWFKKMPIEVTEKFSGHPGTAKRCPSFVDYFSSGIVLKLWCDISPGIFKWITGTEFTMQAISIDLIALC